MPSLETTVLKGEVTRVSHPQGSLRHTKSSQEVSLRGSDYECLSRLTRKDDFDSDFRPQCVSPQLCLRMGTKSLEREFVYTEEMQ